MKKIELEDIETDLSSHIELMEKLERIQKLDHPNVLKYCDYINDEGCLYLIFEYFD